LRSEKQNHPTLTGPPQLHPTPTFYKETPRESAEFQKRATACILLLQTRYKFAPHVSEAYAMKPSDRPIRVLVADDSPSALACICQYLEFEGTFEIVGTASDSLRLMQKAERLRPDLMLTDLNIPLLNGLEATTELRRLFPELRIVVI